MENQDNKSASEVVNKIAELMAKPEKQDNVTELPGKTATDVVQKISELMKSQKESQAPNDERQGKPYDESDIIKIIKFKLSV